MAQCRSLVQLSVEGCDVGELGIAELTTLQRLQLLDLRGTRVLREDLTTLRGKVPCTQSITQRTQHPLYGGS